MTAKNRYKHRTAIDKIVDGNTETSTSSGAGHECNAGLSLRRPHPDSQVFSRRDGLLTSLNGPERRVL